MDWPISHYFLVIIFLFNVMIESEGTINKILLSWIKSPETNGNVCTLTTLFFYQTFIVTILYRDYFEIIYLWWTNFTIVLTSCEETELFGELNHPFHFHIVRNTPTGFEKTLYEGYVKLVTFCQHTLVWRGQHILSVAI